MGVPRRWTVYDCPSGCVFVRHDRIGPQSCPFCDAHPVCDPVEVEAALPDDQLREKVADTLGRVMPQSIPFERGRMLMLADAAIDVVRGVSAAPAPHYPEAVVVEDELTGKPIVKVIERSAPAPPERDLWAATIRAAEEVVEARGFTDADVERVALVLAAHDDESFNDVARAVLAAVGPTRGDA